MRAQEIEALIRESESAGGITALEEYDNTGKLPFEKERISFTIERKLLEEFRKKYKGSMSGMVEGYMQSMLPGKRLISR